MGRCLTVLAVLLVMAGMSARSASAHSNLTGSAPADGQVLTATPATITLTFNEAIDPSFTIVVAAVDGGEQAELPATVDGSTVTATLDQGRTSQDQAPVPWDITYRVVSGDGHPIEGTIGFTAPAAPAPPPAATPSPDPVTTSPATSTAPPSSSGSPSATAVPDLEQPTDVQAEGSGWTAPLLIAGLAMLLFVLLVLVWRRGRSDPS